jgi:hypothetical protein
MLWIIIILFSADVIIETSYDLMQEHLSVTEQEANVCLAQFIN